MLLFASALWLTGCASMQVRVAILDSRALDTAAFQQAAAEAVENRVLGNRQLGRYQEFREQVIGAARSALQEALADPDLARAIPQDDQFRSQLLSDIEQEAAATLTAAQLAANNKYESGSAQLRQVRSLGRGNEQRRREAAAAARTAFAEGDQALVEGYGSLRRKLADFFTNLGVQHSLPETASAQLASRALQRVENATRPALDSLIGDAGILDDPLASQVVNAPRAYWRGTFNRAYGSGHMGNADIAVKMQGLGDFTLKGVRLDATKVTPAVFQATLMLAKVAAASLGVPVGLAGTGEGEGKGVVIGEDLLTADVSRAEARRKQELSKFAALEVLEAIVAERQPLTAPDGADPNVTAEARKAAVARLKRAFGDLRGQLEIVQPSTTESR